MPTADGIRFITGYDYSVRFGLIGKIVDRILFRPLLGWATAWSFDRLRLWLEQGLDSSASLRQSLINVIVRITLAFVFIYQGLVPKLIQHHTDELIMLRNTGVAGDLLPTVVALVGMAEVLYGLLILLTLRRPWPFVQ